MRTGGSGIMTNFLNDKALGLEGLDVLERRNLAHAGYEIIGRLSEQLAHDIRSPLSAMKMIMRGEDLNASKEILALCVKRVEELIEKFKATCLAKISGREALENISFDECLNWILEEKKAQFKSRLEVQVKNRAPQALIQAKDADLKILLSNVINNAIESYSEQDVAKVHVDVCSQGHCFEVTIKDYGCGISPEHLHRLGRRGLSFGKLSKPDSGHGLGLYSAIETMKAWGGELHIESELGQGTLVRLRFNRVKVDHRG